MSIPYATLGRKIGEMVEEKQKASGDSFGKAGRILQELYPDGVTPKQYDDMLCMVRIIDKLFRIATDKNAFGENPNPYMDIAGYAILGASKMGLKEGT